MATRRIKEFLLGSGARFATISHSPAYSAKETAESIHIPGHCMAKTVIVWIDGRLAMVVLPASSKLDLESVRLEMSASRVRVAAEADFAGRFRACDLGTVPPFGNVFGMDTIVDVTLTHQSHIAFLAGTHADVIVIETPDYVRLVRPMLAHVVRDDAELAAEV